MKNGILLTRSKAAAYLGLTPETISRYSLELEDFPAQIRIGGRIFFRQTDIDAWVARLGNG